MNHDHQSPEHHSDMEARGGANAETEAPKKEGGDVLSLIADVERHLERIREVQNRQSTDFADLAERQRRVSEAETVLADRGGELEARAVDLANSQQTIEAERREIETLRVEVDQRRSGLEEAEGDVDALRAELDGVRSELETERERLSEWERELDGNRSLIDQRSAEFENREHELVERIATAEAASAAARNEMERASGEYEIRLGESERAREEHATRENEFRARCEGLESDLADIREASDESRDTLGRISDELESARVELTSARSELEAAEARIEEGETARDEQGSRDRETIDSLEARFAEVEARCRSFETTADEREHECEESRARATELESSLEQANRRIAELDARVVEDERQIGLAGGKLAELAQLISEQTPRLEQGAEAMALVPALESRIRELQAELAANQGGGDAEMSALRETTSVRIDQLERDLEAANARIAEPVESEDPARLQALIEEARSPLEERIAELEASAAEPTDGDEVSRTKYDSLKQRCVKAERRSDELDTALAMANDRGQAQEMAKRLRAKAEKVGDYARHLETRKRRLAAVRIAMAGRYRAGATSNEEGGAHEMQRIEAQRRELEQVREFLGRSEQQMVRRWARPRSVAMVAWIMVLFAVSAGAGWFGVHEFVPTPGAASVTVNAVAPDGKALMGESEAAWDEWHAALATDPAFVAMVHERLVARGLATGGEEQTARMMADDLVFEDEGHGRLRLLLSGSDARVLEPTLDVIATSLASESARQAPRRKDGARATLPTERATATGVGYATLVKGPYGSEAISRMAMIAGGVFAASVLLIVGFYGLLSRSKRVFEEREAIEGASG
ncbi:MAG: hypothetical protein GY895_09215 [Phycisphaera sp.]|nr:hypothetical protein [Phycisphaera sp.]